MMQAAVGRSCEELKEAVQTAWAKIDSDTLKRLEESMHDRRVQVLMSQGDKTKYSTEFRINPD
jgi:hypothetical protein